MTYNMIIATYIIRRFIMAFHVFSLTNLSFIVDILDKPAQFFLCIFTSCFNHSRQPLEMSGRPCSIAMELNFPKLKERFTSRLCISIFIFILEMHILNLLRCNYCIPREYISILELHSVCTRYFHIPMLLFSQELYQMHLDMYAYLFISIRA